MLSITKTQMGAGCPVRQVRHIYRRNGGGPLLNYSPLVGVCRIGCGAYKIPNLRR